MALTPGLFLRIGLGACAILRRRPTHGLEGHLISVRVYGV